MNRAVHKLAWELQRIFAELIELDKTAPEDVDQLVSMLLAHLRSWRPMSVAPLGTLPEPEEPVVDPRTVTKPLRGTKEP